jgi:hypothetical protein
MDLQGMTRWINGRTMKQNFLVCHRAYKEHYLHFEGTCLNVNAGNILSKFNNSHVCLTPCSDLARQRNVGEGVLHHVAVLVDVGHSELDSALVSRRDEAVGPRAFSRDVQVNDFLSVVLHSVWRLWLVPGLNELRMFLQIN